MRATHALLGLLVIGCQPAEPQTRLTAPPRLRQALIAGVDDLGATAQLVPNGGAALPAVELSRGQDGVSFSGFLPADPGDYALEVTFDGQIVVMGERAFLGRLTSDSFTVSGGETHEAVFSKPLDTLGRDGDGGDLDGDGLGNLDEVLWNSQPNAGDSDGDGLADGEDCDPGDPSRTFVIAEGGSVLDCDADGVTRGDVPFGQPGEDCNDKDPSVKPGADDVCGDGIDQDCDPATCGAERIDFAPPVFESVTPAAGGSLGCHSTVQAVITDDTEVASAYVAMTGCPLGERVLTMSRVDGTLWESVPVNRAGGGSEGIPVGCAEVEIRAVDTFGNQAVLARSFSFAFEVPSIGRFDPETIGALSAPVQIDLEASASAGISRIELWTAPHGVVGYDLNQGRVLASSESGALAFSLDPSAFADGDHILFPTVLDNAGNALHPGVSGSVSAGGVWADYLCLPFSQAPTIPSRVIAVGQSSLLPAKMRDHLSEAIAEAAATDPDAQLVSAKAFGIDSNGQVDLTDASSFMKRWEYGFYNDSARTWVTVSWYTPAMGLENPVVNANAGNVVESEPFPDPSILVDSDAAAAAFVASPGCGSLAGADDDYILYGMVDGAPAVTIGTYAATWRGTATPPISTLIACQ